MTELIYCMSRHQYNVYLKGDQKLGIKGLGSHEAVIDYLNQTGGYMGRIVALRIE